MTDPAETVALGWLADQADAMEQALGDLVRVSSWSDDREGVTAAGVLYRTMIPLPCVATPAGRYAEQLRFDGAGGAANDGGVVIVGHMDTVFERARFSGYRRDGARAFGPGVFDMKGGLVVVAFAMRALERAGLLAALPVSVVVVSDEEVGSPEGTPAIEGAARGARAALVFESGRPGDAIVVARKGTRGVRATARGRAAHAGNEYARGANAVWALARFIERAQRLTDLDRGVTVNVGAVRGGSARNVVPDQAEAVVDLRFETSEQEGALRTALAEAASREMPEGTSVEIAWDHGRAPLEPTDKSLALARSYGACQRASGLGDGVFPRVGGGSDASTTAAMGVPSIDGLGPRGSGFHTLDEQVELDSLVPKAAALVRYLSRHGRGA